MKEPKTPEAPAITCPPALPEMTPEELSAAAWDRINEAMAVGAMFLPGGRVVTLGPDNVVKLVQWLATLKAKRPKAVMKPEDYTPKETK